MQGKFRRTIARRGGIDKTQNPREPKLNCYHQMLDTQNLNLEQLQTSHCSHFELLALVIFYVGSPLTQSSRNSYSPSVQPQPKGEYYKGFAGGYSGCRVLFKWCFIWMITPNLLCAGFVIFPWPQYIEPNMLYSMVGPSNSEA